MLNMEMQGPELEVSTRNRYPGVVTAVRMGPVDAEVVVEVNDHDTLVVTVTQFSVERLGLRPGVEVVALVNASAVIVSVGAEAPRTSARNVLCGIVTESGSGAVNGEVMVTTSGGLEVAAVVTRESIHRLGLEVGSPACALFKASGVLLALPM